MGASQSTGTNTQHVFAADTPIRFSENVVTSLQKSSETDSTRATNIELHIQSRVTSELEKLLDAASQRLTSASETVSQEDPKTQPQDSVKSLKDRISEKILGSSDVKSANNKEIDRDVVSGEINALKEKLARRRQIVEMDKSVADAKQQVVECLRLNDRRPLDCWEEVERFKAEVGRMEKNFVDSQGA